MRSPSRRSNVVLLDSDRDTKLNPLQYIWWMITSDFTILIYSLIFFLLIALDIALHLAGIGG